MSAQDKHKEQHKEHHKEKDDRHTKDSKDVKEDAKKQLEKDFDKKHEAEIKEHERLEKARESVLKEKTHGAPEPAPSQLKHVPSAQERAKKGWGGAVDVLATDKDEDPMKVVAPVLGTEYMEVDSRDLQVQDATSEEMREHRQKLKDAESDQILKDREELRKREGR
jgi:hypothetical protein